MDRVFTVEEVNAILGELSELVGSQLHLRSEIEQAIAELTRVSGEAPRYVTDGAGDSPETRRLKRLIREQVRRYEAGWKAVQEMGGAVKDPSAGLVDFLGQVEGQLVWLCWRYGEERLSYFHPLDAGYSARRPLSSEIRARLLN
jgi:hypothetical protein